MSCCTHLAMVLSAGRAPACEQRAREQAALWRGNFDRVCSWLDDFCQSSPILQDEPLLGSCLPELTAQLGRPGKPEVEKARSRRRVPAGSLSEDPRPVSCSPVEHVTPSAPACPEPNRSSPVVKRKEPACPALSLKIEKREADAGLLHRLCPGSREILPQAESLAYQLPLLPSCPDPQPAPSHPMALDDWFRSLRQRTDQRLQSETGSQVSKKTGPDVFPRERDLRPESQSLDGTSAPERLLLELSADTASANAKSNAREPRETQALGSDEKDRSALPALPAIRKPHVVSDNRVSDDRVETTERQTSPAPAQLHSLPEISPAASTATVVTDAASPLLIHASPPHSFPALHFPLSSSPTGTLRHSSKVDASTPDEDLGVLAEKIKRILNEEARRFGIDV
jgi:hypothetical protein